MPMLLFFPSKPGRILQARQNFASSNFGLGSRERFGDEQIQIPESLHAYRVHLVMGAMVTPPEVPDLKIRTSRFLSIYGAM
jgi:hypothetical protein